MTTVDDSDRSQTQPPASSERKKSSSFKRRLFKFFACATAIVVLPLAWAVFNNNVSLTGKSSAEIEAELDTAIELGVKWIVEHREEFETENGNAALLFMIGDMNQPTAMPELEEIFAKHLTQRSATNFWRRILVPDAKTRILDQRQLAKYVEYKRWAAYAIAADKIELSEEVYNNMMSPDKNAFRDLTHQLYAVDILRDRGSSAEGIDDLIDTLCHRITRECSIDFRVTDLYLQRVAFVLAADRPDLIKKRWIERILANQHENGGFLYSWCGSSPNPLRFSGSKKPVAHATVQGIWLLYMIRHRSPDWIAENFPD